MLHAGFAFVVTYTGICVFLPYAGQKILCQVTGNLHWLSPPLIGYHPSYADANRCQPLLTDALRGFTAMIVITSAAAGTPTGHVRCCAKARIAFAAEAFGGVVGVDGAVPWTATSRSRRACACATGWTPRIPTHYPLGGFPPPGRLAGRAAPLPPLRVEGPVPPCAAPPRSDFPFPLRPPPPPGLGLNGDLPGVPFLLMILACFLASDPA